MTKEVSVTDNRSLSPAVEACLCRRVPSSQKGGTLIAEDVHDLGAHERLLADPDGYRPSGCPRCGAALHVHDLRSRVLHGEQAVATEVVRFRCADREHCGAAWQILPAFLARYLWGSWSRIHKAMTAGAASPVPVRTRRRWAARLASSARLLVAVLGTATDGVFVQLAMQVGLSARRCDLVALCGATPGRAYSLLAAALHRLSPGVRLM